MAALHSPSEEHEEGAPLLSPIDSALQTALLPTAPPKKEEEEEKKKKKKPWLVLVSLIYLLVAIVDIGAFMADPPKTRIFEANLCVRYYQEADPSKINSDGTVDEALCKVNEVQQKLAMIFGWQDMFDSIPGILLAVPYGTLADKWGRKWVLALGLIGLQLSTAWIVLICYFPTLPLQLTWFSSAFQIIGGGGIVAVAIAITMISDICPPDKRTSIFVYLTASVLVGELIAPILAAKLMAYGNWIPLLLALAIQQVGTCLAFWFPETLHLRDLPEPKDGESEHIELQSEERGHGFKAQLHNLKDAFAFFKSDFMLAMIVCTFLANRLGRQSITLIIRYASKRYSWSIADASYLISFRAGTNLVALLLFIPGLSFFLLRYKRLPAHFADLVIARGSIVLYTISMVLMGVAAKPALLIMGLLVFNLGTGFNASMRSVAIHIVGGQASPDIGRLMSVIAILESIGATIAGPLLNKTFEWAMDVGEPWIGLPFLGSGLVYGIMTFMTFIISVKAKETAYMEIYDEEPMLARASSDAGTRLRRSKSSSTVHRQPPPVLESMDPDLAQKHALAAAATAFARAHANSDTAGPPKRGSSDLARSKSTASRKSLSSQGSHFPPRESSFRSPQQPQRPAQTSKPMYQSRAPTMVTEKFPPFHITPNMDKPPLTQLVVPPTTENSRPSSQPKTNRSSVSSTAASQQIRKARSMYYASSVQTGSPIPRPPVMYLSTPPPVSVSPALEVPPSSLPSRAVALSPLPSPYLPVTVAQDDTVDKARDRLLQDFQQRQVKHRPSLFLAPFKKRQDKGKRSTSSSAGLSYNSLHTPADTTLDFTLSDFQPHKDKKEKRSFSGSIKNKIKRVFRRTSNNATLLPVQQIEASRDYFGDYAPVDPPPRMPARFDIPSPDEQTLQRTRARTPSRDIKRLTVIHEAKDSIGSEADHIALTSPKRKSTSTSGFAAFREPMPMESLVEEASTPVDPKRVFSALMREIDASKTVQTNASSLEITQENETDVFVSSARTDFQSLAMRELHSSASRDLRVNVNSDPRPPSRRRLEGGAAPSKPSSIRSFGRALRSTIRTVTPSEAPDRTTSVRGVVRIPRPDTAASFSTTNSEHKENENEDDTTGSINFKMHSRRYYLAVTPTAEQIEQRVQKSKGRWKAPIEEGPVPFFPRTTKRAYAVTNMEQTTVPSSPASQQGTVQGLLEMDAEVVTEEQHYPSTTFLQRSPRSPRPKPIFSPMSPSVYSRNTDGVSLLPNDSVMSLDGVDDEDDQGSAVIITSHSVRRHVIGTPSPHRHTESTRSSQDWKAWLSREVSELEHLPQHDIRMNDRFPFIETSKRSSNNSARISRISRSPPDSGSSSVNSKKTPSPKVYSDFSAPSTGRTLKYEPNKRSKRGQDINDDKENKRENKKENATPSLRTSTFGASYKGSSHSPPIGKTKSLQPLSSPVSNRLPSSLAQYTTTAAEVEVKSTRISTIATSSPRPHLRAQVRPLTPGKLTIRPKSAFDLRNINSLPVAPQAVNSPGPGKCVRRPPIHTKHSSSTLAFHKEPSPDTEETRIDNLLDANERSGRISRAGSVTPGQRLAERFLRERSLGSGAASPVTVNCVTDDGEDVRSREGLTPAFL
ncbi:MFS general substrate transporter [Pleomassaria siparia CBS 279.74]|uniref:MFS general substrate transporter n=1 Tax=Pleomassaria siparia CBS 279.74 TaxID=1314801 RepID=A0A6G1JTB0_9PLEO|nr:MFS general substrate transporter [Pleomassaria siparia CBS 279.74]